MAHIPVFFGPLLAAVLIGNVSQAKTATADAVSGGRNLDLSSFPNSTGPRREPGKKTPDDYGFTAIEDNGRSAIFSQADRSWRLSLKILSEGPGHILACFGDEANNGGSYNTQRALDLTLGRDGLYVAKMTAAVPSCPSRP